ncbi:heme-binding protein [Rhizobium leguminosarum]|nr:heme-binding protein [Rhizobium leguminosarum]
MMIKRTTYTALAVFMLAAASATPGFAQSVPPYGAPISIERAKQVAAAALAEMRKKGFEMTVAIVDSGSNLVYLERSNQAGIGTIDAALGKAKAANGIKTPTKAIEDVILHNNQSNLLAVPGAFSGRRRSASRRRWPGNRCDRRQWRHARR